MTDAKDNFSAGEQAFGYLYQVRFAHFQMVSLPENAACFNERDDDIKKENNPVDIFMLKFQLTNSMAIMFTRGIHVVT